MRKKLIELCHYNWWANTQILNALENLSDHEFEADLGGSFASISQTMNHILWVEWLYLRRWQGLSTEDLFPPFSLKQRAAIRQSWAELKQEQEQYFQALDERTLDGIIQYFDSKKQQITIQLWQAIFQAINHSTFHRGQVISKFRQLGKTPPSTDFIGYCRANIKHE